MIPMTWPFATSGLDVVRPFKKAPGGFTHLFVAINKFTKWVEVEAVTEVFKGFMSDLGIQINYASVSHPLSNGQVE